MPEQNPLRRNAETGCLADLLENLVARSDTLTSNVDHFICDTAFCPPVQDETPNVYRLPGLINRFVRR